MRIKLIPRISFPKIGHADYGAAIASLLILIYAGATFWSVNVGPFDKWQLYHWYFHYGEGYVHRGLAGSLVKLFAGVPSPAQVQSVVPKIQTAMTFINILFLWALLFPRIILKFPPPSRVAMLAFAALLLLSPVWKEFALHIGFMDVYVFFFGLCAAAALVGRRPFWFALFLFVGVLLHRQAILFAAGIGLAALHAAWWLPEFRARRMHWAAAVAAQPMLFLFLSVLHDGDAAEQLLRATGFSEILTQVEHLRESNLSVGFAKPLERISEMSMHSRNALIGVFIFGGPPLLAAATLPIWTRKLRLRFAGDDEKTRQIADYLLPSAAILTLVPLQFVSVDWARHFYQMWMLLAMIFVYYAWFLSPIPQGKRKTRAQKRGGGVRQNARIAAIVFGFCGWMFAGMPYITAHLATPTLFPCARFCVALFTAHAPGTVVAEAITRWQINAILPVSVNPAHHRRSLNFPELLPLRDGRLLASGGGITLANRWFSANPGIISYKAIHKTDAPQRLELLINDRPFQPSVATSGETEWRIGVSSFGQYHSVLRTAPNAGEVELISIHIDTFSPDG